jgi:hypothetical protein
MNCFQEIRLEYQKYLFNFLNFFNFVIVRINVTIMEEYEVGITLAPFNGEVETSHGDSFLKLCNFN